jgi:hypothetical protein
MSRGARKRPERKRDVGGRREAPFEGMEGMKARVRAPWGTTAALPRQVTRAGAEVQAADREPGAYAFPTRAGEIFEIRAIGADRIT